MCGCQMRITIKCLQCTRNLHPRIYIALMFFVIYHPQIVITSKKQVALDMADLRVALTLNEYRILRYHLEAHGAAASRNLTLVVFMLHHLIVL